MKYTIGRLTLALSTCAACSCNLDPQSTSSGNGGTSTSSLGGDSATSQGTATQRPTVSTGGGGGSSLGSPPSKAGNSSTMTTGGVVGVNTSAVVAGGNAPISATSRGGNAPVSATSRGGNAPVSATSRGGSAARTVGGATAAGATQATGGTQTGGTSTNPSTASTRRLPDANVPFDYQIGGAYAPPTGVQIVSRDRTSQPASGIYNICYVNGFQSQPDEEAFWKDQHPELLLRNASGAFVVDEDWGEYLLDTSTPDRRQALGTIVGEWIKQCAKDGFDAIEVDNLDSYSRSGGLLNQSQNVAMMRILSDVAHANGLAVAQKNSTELLESVGAMGTDFAVAEECNRWDECADYQRAYGNRVYIIEYRASDFKAGCTSYPELSIVLRDLNVSTPSSGGYVFEGC